MLKGNPQKDKKMIQFDEIRALADAATPGPWVTTACDVVVVGAGEQVYVADTSVSGRPTQNAAFIAAAREAIPVLLAEVERLRAFLTEEADRCETWDHHADAKRIRQFLQGK